MFGNRVGWIISALLTIVIGLITYFLSTLNVISPLSVGIIAKQGNVSLNLGNHPEILDPIQLPFNPQAIVPGMTESRDPAATYHEAIKLYIEDKKSGNFLYRDLFERGKPSTTDLKQLPALQLLIDVRNSRTANIFGSNPAEIIDYDPDSYERIDALYNLGKTAWKLGLYIKGEQHDQAVLLAEAAFSLGAKMCEERLRYQEFESGTNLVREAALVLKSVVPERANEADIDAPMKRLLKDRCIPLWTAIGSADPQIVARTGGDIFYIAKNAKEPMWRIEAIMKLGRNRFDIGDGRAADQRWAGIIVKRMSNDPNLDPLYHTAAKAAFELTHDGYLKIRS